MNNHNFLEALLENSGIRSAHGVATSLALTIQKGDCVGLQLNGKLWAFVEKSKMTLSLENPDITQTACRAYDRFQAASIQRHQAGWLLKQARV